MASIGINHGGFLENLASLYQRKNPILSHILNIDAIFFHRVCAKLLLADLTSKKQLTSQILRIKEEWCKMGVYV